MVPTLACFFTALLPLPLPIVRQDPAKIPVVRSSPAPAPTVPADKEVVTTASGLAYSILERGETGKSPKLGDIVKVHYSGWLTDGTLFDSSVQRNAPAQFELGKVIAGWNEGLALMTKGARFKLTIPGPLAYGEQGRPPKIPANATLIFEVALLDFTAMPEFHPARPEAQIALPTGVKYEVLREGSGEPPPAGRVLVMNYAVFSLEGKLLDCSEKRGGSVKAKLEELAQSGVPFLEGAAAMLEPGARLRFEVPPEQASSQPPEPGAPPPSPLVWELELVSSLVPLANPPFEVADDSAIVTASGLKYVVVKEGEGEQPKPGESASLHYVGWLVTGKVFDSSFERGEPATIPVGGGMIPGLAEGLQLMRPGAIYRFTIPSGLAYGPGGSPPLIGPNANLIFYVELIRVGT